LLKKLLLTFIVLLTVVQTSFAKDIDVKITPLRKISTANVNLNEGDNIYFTTTEDVDLGKTLYLRAGTTVSGTITSIVNNSFTCQEASIYAENFHLLNTSGKTVNLKGILYIKGRTHWMFMQFIPIFYEFVRGGEVKILPKRDIFTLYLEGEND